MALKREVGILQQENGHLRQVQLLWPVLFNGLRCQLVELADSGGEQGGYGSSSQDLQLMVTGGQVATGQFGLPADGRGRRSYTTPYLHQSQIILFETIALFLENYLLGKAKQFWVELSQKCHVKSWAMGGLDWKLLVSAPFSSHGSLLLPHLHCMQFATIKGSLFCSKFTVIPYKCSLAI